MENMDDILQKAQVLVEALPYIQRFNRRKHLNLLLQVEQDNDYLQVK